MMSRVLEGQGLSFGHLKLSFQHYLLSALLMFLQLGFIRQFLQRGEPQICTIKLLSLDFMANLGFVVPGSGVKVGKSIRAQLTHDSSNSSN